jgi:hypothetical protein
MVKSYLRHGGTEAFGIIASSSSNSVFDGRKAYVPSLEDVLVWEVKKGELVRSSFHLLTTEDEDRQRETKDET